MGKMNSKSCGILDERYTLECKIGDGASSNVYKVKDSFSDNYYAAKIFEEHSEIFDREILFNKKILKSKDNNHFFIKYISSSLNATLDNDKEQKCYILFELATKGSLSQYVFNYGAPFDEKNCKVISYKIILALQSLHEIGICHRDIKAENILLKGERFDIKIADFGLSGFIYGNNGKILQNEKVGTDHYMAPEVLYEKEYDGEKSDIFSTGVLLFTLLTRKIPFPIAIIFNKGTKIQKLYKLIKEKDEKNYWETLKEKQIEGLSPEFKDLFFKMVAYKPNERPSLNEILNHSWMKEVTNLNKEEYIKYEEDLISELKKRKENL